jgi:Kef-type K+ transport system membrane component KefB
MTNESTTTTEWTCPNCGTKSNQTFCGQCGTLPWDANDPAVQERPFVQETYRIFFAALIGCVTGFLSAQANLFYFPVPGWLFGLSFLAWRGKLSTKAVTAFCSGLCYYLALIVAMSMMHGGSGSTTDAIQGFWLGGACGAATLWMVLACIRRVEAGVFWMLLTTLIGAFAARAFMMRDSTGGHLTTLQIPFVIWQAVMAAWFAFLAERKATKDWNANKEDQI